MGLLVCCCVVGVLFDAFFGPIGLIFGTHFGDPQAL